MTTPIKRLVLPDDHGMGGFHITAVCSNEDRRSKPYKALWVDFRVHKNVSEVSNPQYRVSGDTPEHTMDPDLAEPFMRGHIKWDGCSEWALEEAAHGCSRADWTVMGPLFAVLFDIAGELMPDNMENLR